MQAPTDEDLGTMMAGHVGSVAMFALYKGVPARDISAATGLRPAELTRLDGRVPAIAMPRLWELIKARHPGEPISLEMAAWAPLSFGGVLALIGRHTVSPHEGTRVLAEFAEIVADKLAVTLVEDEGSVSLNVWHPADALDSGLALEAGVAFMARLAREVFGEQHGLLRVSFVHEPNAPLEAYETFFGAPVNFSANQSGLVFQTNTTNKTSREGTQGLLPGVVGRLTASLSKRQKRHKHSEERLRRAVEHNAEAGQFSVDQLADRMKMSRRTLQRMLRKRGTTARELLDAARHKRAKLLLSDPTLTVCAIAKVLGYADGRVFRRAFKSHTGLSPSEYRARNLP